MNESTDWINSNVNKSEAQRIKYDGVRGFLSLFVAYLRIIKPLAFLYTLISMPSIYYQLKDKFKIDPNMIVDKIMNSMYLFLFIEFILAIYAFNVGCSLLHKRTNAVYCAKRFLLLDYVISVACVFGLVIYASKLTGAAPIYAQPIGKSIAYTLWFFIWFLFLTVSKRVKYTYQSN